MCLKTQFSIYLIISFAFFVPALTHLRCASSRSSSGSNDRAIFPSSDVSSVRFRGMSTAYVCCMCVRGDEYKLILNWIIMTVFTEEQHTAARAGTGSRRYSQWMARTLQPLVSSYFMQCTLTLPRPRVHVFVSRFYALSHKTTRRRRRI